MTRKGKIMATKKHGLGKGLDALFGGDTAAPAEAPAGAAEPEAPERMVRTSFIAPRKDQPRKVFNKESLAELTESVKQYGVLQPLIVRRVDRDSYEIVAGERRWRAAQAAGLKEVPVIVRDYDPQLTTEISIIENLQREDLNPIEEAGAYRQLMEVYGLTQEEVAAKVSKSRSAVTNTLRLLKLEESVQQMLADGTLTEGHARALLAAPDPEQQKALAEEAAENGLSVREVEKKVKSLGRRPKAPSKKQEEARDLSMFYQEYERKMESILGTGVRINRKDSSKGRIEIDYYSQAELERIMDLLRSIREE